MVSVRSPVLDPDAEPGFAIARGLVLHKLLQVLPGIEEAQRREAAARYMERTAGDWPAHEREAALSSVEAIMAAAEFSPLFAPGSRAEVAIMGKLMVKDRLRPVSGKIDRLALTADEVLIVDYKTDRNPPASAEEMPLAYVAQLALYRALLQPLYPGRKVSACLLFTASPSLLKVGDAAMEDALVRITQA
jgi:ATP-dependent helicase/nuclease subunit A